MSASGWVRNANCCVVRPDFRAPRDEGGLKSLSSREVGVYFRRRARFSLRRLIRIRTVGARNGHEFAIFAACSAVQVHFGPRPRAVRRRRDSQATAARPREASRRFRPPLDLSCES